MPRRGGKGNNRRRRSSRRSSGSSMTSGVDRIISIPGRCLLQLPAGGPTAFFGTTALTPGALDTRLANFIASFQFFRFTSISLRLLPGPVTDSQGVAYSKRTLLTITGSNPDALYQLDASRYLTGNTTVPLSLHLRGADLKSGARNWYITDPAASTDLFESQQGDLVCYNSTAGAGVIVECTYVCQFRGPTSPDVASPVARKVPVSVENKTPESPSPPVCHCKH